MPIDPLALRQLAKWENLAKDWPVYRDVFGYVRCAHCDLTVWRVTDNQGKPYTHSKPEILSLRVGHLRQHHPGLEPNEETT